MLVFDFGLIDATIMGDTFETNLLEDVVDMFFLETGAFWVALNRVLDWKNISFWDGGSF